jgi:DNA polymerase (family X)
MNKREIAKILEDIAFFLLLKGENPYKAKAYQKAGLALLTCPEEALVLVESGTLTRVAGIGPATASVLPSSSPQGPRPSITTCKAVTPRHWPNWVRCQD